MPSPFPGMDPYLEDPVRWADIHHELISVIRSTLNEKLLPNYVARIDERVYLDKVPDPIQFVPDVFLIDGSSRKHDAFTPSQFKQNVAQPVAVTLIEEEEIRESFIRIEDPKSSEVVTVIEILSPANKTKGSQGQGNYAKKRDDILKSNAHFVEIDLLRFGEHAQFREKYPPCDYAIHISRRDKRPRSTMWPIQLDQQLPILPIPLRPKDGDVPLDLQLVLSAAYKNGGYYALLDYNQPPELPLPEQYVEWADRLLREKGARK